MSYQEDMMGLDMAEAERTIRIAVSDVEGVGADSIGWASPDIEPLADAAAKALEDLADAIAAAWKRLPS